MMDSKTRKYVHALLAAGLLAAAALFFVGQDPFQVFRQAVEMNLAWGAAIYVFLEVLSIVVVPVATIVLVPVAVEFFGPFLAGIYSILGWAAGGALAFFIARHLGRPAVEKIFDIKEIKKYRRYISADINFWTVVALRLLLPVDILSYALGLFSLISFRNYMLATLIGITPFAFIFTYTGEALIKGRWGRALFLALAGLAILISLWAYIKRKYKKP